MGAISALPLRLKLYGWKGSGSQPISQRSVSVTDVPDGAGRKIAALRKKQKSPNSMAASRMTETISCKISRSRFIEITSFLMDSMRKSREKCGAAHPFLFNSHYITDVIYCAWKGCALFCKFFWGNSQEDLIFEKNCNGLLYCK